MSEQYSDKKANKFLYHLASAKKRRNDRDESLKDMEKQFRKVKSFFKKTGDPKILLLLEDLEKKINIAIEKESRIIRHQYDEKAYHMQLMRKIALLEERLHDFVLISRDRSERLKILEDKVKKNVTLGTDVEFVEERIHDLKSQYKKLKSSGKFDKRKLNSIKKRIEVLTKKLETL